MFLSFNYTFYKNDGEVLNNYNFVRELEMENNEITTYEIPYFLSDSLSFDYFVLKPNYWVR